MTIPENILRSMFSGGERQENIEFDSDGNEIYHGVASINATNADAMWAIAKGVYSTQAASGVKVMTHVSFLYNQIWDDRASITFP